MTEIPDYLKKFHDKFQKISQGMDDVDVFEDFLDYLISLFSYDYQWKPRKNIPEYAPKLFELFKEYLQAFRYKIETENKGWCDIFGTYYELVIASNNRRKNSGQFFTPEHVVDLMVDLQTSSRNESKRSNNVIDPACGSGRFLIAYHGKFPQDSLFAADIDYTCARMTVCNFIMHGCCGEVVWQDSLSPESYYGGWTLKAFSVEDVVLPLIQCSALLKEQSRTWNFWQDEAKSRKNSCTQNFIQLNLF